MLTNLKIGTRMAVGFSLILALLLVITGLGINRMGSLAANTDETVTRAPKTSRRQSPRPELAAAKKPMATPAGDDDGQWEAFSGSQV